MSRQADPARIDEARRAAIRNSLIGEGVTEATAEAWIAAWDAEAAHEGLEPGRVYWERGWDWITRKKQLRSRP
jgi:hypothetical protein